MTDKPSPAWVKAVEEIKKATCDKSRMEAANRFFNDNPQEAAKMWQSRGVTNEQVATVDGKVGLTNHDASALLVAMATLSKGGVLADSVSGSDLVHKGQEFCRSMSCQVQR